MLTFIPLEEIAKFEKMEGAELNEAKKVLAYELTSMVHGKEKADIAKATAESLFSAGSAANMPSVKLSEEDFTKGHIDILSLLMKAELATSKSDARRAVEQGGVVIDNDKVNDVKLLISVDQVKNGFVLRKGKKNFKKVEMK